VEQIPGVPADAIASSSGRRKLTACGNIVQPGRQTLKRRVIQSKATNQVDAGRDRAGRRRRSLDALDTAHTMLKPKAHTFIFIPERHHVHTHRTTQTQRQTQTQTHERHGYLTLHPSTHPRQDSTSRHTQLPHHHPQPHSTSLHESPKTPETSPVRSLPHKLLIRS
jgi:hypothetical protein